MYTKCYITYHVRDFLTKIQMKMYCEVYFMFRIKYQKCSPGDLTDFSFKVYDAK